MELEFIPRNAMLPMIIAGMSFAVLAVWILGEVAYKIGFWIASAIARRFYNGR
jgi:hypothetical protein